MPSVLMSLAAWGLALALSGPAVHDDSVSRTLIVSEGERIEHFVRLQAESLWEVLPLDPDGNRWVEPAEFEAQRGAIGAYLQEHYRLSVDGELALAADEVSTELITDERDAFSMRQWVELHLVYAAPREPRSIEVAMDLFRATSPTHVDLCVVSWAAADGSVAPGPSLRLWAGDPVQQAHSGRPRPWHDDLHHGVRIVLGGPLAAACLLALLLSAVRAAPTPRSGRVALAFAVALGVALALGDRLPDPGGAGVAAALAVVYAAVLDLGARRGSAGSGAPRASSPVRGGGRPLVIEALVFGALQGLALRRLDPVPVDGSSLLVAAGAASTLALTGALAGRLLPRGALGGGLALAALGVGVHGTLVAWWG